jgi:hypothetical protein
MINAVIDRKVTSAAGRSDGIPVYIAGFEHTYQIVGPAALGGFAVSHDGVNWLDVVTGITSTLNIDLTKSLWVRPFVAADGLAPRIWTFRFVTHKELS